MMRIPNQIKVAAATVIVVGSVSHAMLPASQDKSDPAKAQREYHREHTEQRRRELEELRLRAEREGRAIDAERYRAAEIRLKREETGVRVARSLLRRRP
jgi:hypothetical protein